MRTHSLLVSVSSAFLILTFSLPAPAALRMPAVISDHMMLQAGKPAAIWGWADPGAMITVSIGAGDARMEGFNATAGADGRWFGQLPVLKPGPAGWLQIDTSKGDKVKIEDIMVGEVWLCGGQSNMSYLVYTPSKNANERTTPELMKRAQDEATAAGGTIRYFDTRHRNSDTPLDDVTGKWILATPETVGACFALSWNFAVTMHEKTHDPIGLIDSAVGGTVIEAWTPKTELDACPAGPDLEKRYDERAAKLAPAIKAKYEADLAEWTKKYPTPALREQQLATRPMLAGGNSNIPARLYNGMIRGLEPYTLKGVIWFQGDGNCPHPQDYGVLFKTLIGAWRAHFHDEHLPFYYVEMQNYRAPQTQPVEPNALSEIREQQQAALELPGVDVATGVDQGVSVPNYEAHFPDKKQLGQRLAGLALDHLFGRSGLAHSPQFKSAKVEGNKIRLQFEYVDSLRLRGGELRGFAIRAADGPWMWAKGQIDGKDIVLWSDQIAKPTDVRYGWAYNPLLSVENSAGLPLRPFRTDTASAR